LNDAGREDTLGMMGDREGLDRKDGNDSVGEGGRKGRILGDWSRGGGCGRPSSETARCEGEGACTNAGERV